MYYLAGFAISVVAADKQGNLEIPVSPSTVVIFSLRDYIPIACVWKCFNGVLAIEIELGFFLAQLEPIAVRVKLEIGLIGIWRSNAHGGLAHDANRHGTQGIESSLGQIFCPLSIQEAVLPRPRLRARRTPCNA